MNNICETIDIPFASKNRARMKEVLSLDDLMRISEPIIKTSVEEVHNALNKANLTAGDIDLVILAGGSSQLPGVREMIKEEIGISPCAIPKNLMMAVSYGATLYQREIFNLPKGDLDKKILGDGLGIYVNTNGKVDLKILMPGNTVLPATETFSFPVDSASDVVTISLVSTNGKNKKNLQKRDLRISRSTRTIKITLSVDENKLVELTALNPKEPKHKLKMSCDAISLDFDDIERNKEILKIKRRDIPLTLESQQCIGIDLGTTTSELTYCNRAADSELKELANPDFKMIKDSGYSKTCFPSVVFFKNGFDHPEVATRVAINAMDKEPNCFSCFKVANHFKPIERADHSTATIDGKEIMVQDLSALLLNKIWEVATTELPTPPSGAVITVPASYDVDECADTYIAAKTAGIDNVVLIDEPTAAIYYYTHIQGIDTKSVKNVMVFDFGGGTTDVAILDIINNKNKGTSKFKACQFDVLATSGNTHCGGRDIDAALYDAICKRFLSKNEGDEINAVKKSEIKKAIEKAKISLSEKYYQ